jgi:NOL1/NOP2/fmu family ribosome biogenesis protein
LQIIAGNLYIKKAGIELGAVKGKDLIPSHELAMSCLDLSHIKNFHLNKQEALQYLSKKEVNINVDSIGWTLVNFENIALGWIKALPNRINNYYPTEWRILKDNF